MGRQLREVWSGVLDQIRDTFPTFCINSEQDKVSLSA